MGAWASGQEEGRRAQIRRLGRLEKAFPAVGGLRWKLLGSCWGIVKFFKILKPAAATKIIPSGVTDTALSLAAVGCECLSLLKITNTIV